MNEITSKEKQVIAMDLNLLKRGFYTLERLKEKWQSKPEVVEYLVTLQK